MTPTFPPEFFILLGIDIFLGGSVIVIVFDEHFPVGLPYLLDFGALVGFIQLVLGPQYLTGYPVEMQFYYSAAFAVTAIMAILGSNLYVVFVRGRPRIGCAFAITATLPASLSTLFFMADYVNGVSASLPLLPLLPWPMIWGIFVTASAMIMTAMVAVTRKKGRRMSEIQLAQESKTGSQSTLE